MSKSIILSKTFWINLISFILLWASSLGDSVLTNTVWFGAALYVLNLILNFLSNNTPIKPVVDLTGIGISMKFLIGFVNIAGLAVLAYQYFINNDILNPAPWLTMVISLLTTLIRALTAQPSRWRE